MNVFTRRLLAMRLHPTSSIIRSIRCRFLISVKPHLRTQQYASFRPNLLSDNERTEQKHTAGLTTLRRQAAPAKNEVVHSRDFPPSDRDIPRRSSRPISWRPLFVGSGICVAAFLAAEAIDGRADAQSIRILANSGWRTGTMQDAKNIIAAESISPLTLLDHFFGINTVKWWTARSDGTHATVIIIATNAVVFLAWSLASRVPALYSRMERSFMHFPGVTPSYTLLTSVFSHQSLTHFAFNMIALYSFGPPSFDYLTTQRITQYPNIDHSTSEQRYTMNLNSTSHSIAFFISCGVCANLIPHYIKLLSTRSQALMLSSAAPALLPMPGLGASGAVYSCLFIDAIHNPDHQIALIFLPFIPISIGYGISGMLILDTIGVLRGWRSFDHICHLSGAAIGAGAYHYGPAVWYKAQSLLRGGKISYL